MLQSCKPAAPNKITYAIVCLQAHAAANNTIFSTLRWLQQVLQEDLQGSNGWLPSHTHLFGFSQGGSTALHLAENSPFDNVGCALVILLSCICLQGYAAADNTIFSTLKWLRQVLQSLQGSNGWQPSHIHLFGFSQGGSAALHLALHCR